MLLVVPDERTINGWVRLPLHPGWRPLTMSEDPPSRENIWYLIRSVQDNPDLGMSLFTGSRAQRKANWVTLRNFIRQARANDESGALMHGSSGALLHYYTVLNLAKAYLVLAAPQSVIGARIGHGLSYNPTTARTHHADAVYARPGGVFTLLYEKTTGYKLAANKKLPVRLIFRQIPEVGRFVGEAGYGLSRAASLHHVLTYESASNEWASLLGLYDWMSGFKEETDISNKHLRKSYVEINHPANWQALLGVSSQAAMIGGHLRFFQSKKTFATQQQAAEASWNALAPLVDCALESHRDGLLCPSLYKTKMLPMPTFLARYAAMFYLSSLVRYRPDWLDPYAFGKESLLFDAAADQCPVHIISGFLDLLRGGTHQFELARLLG